MSFGKNILLTLFSVLSVAALAQNTGVIQGKILDRKTQEALIGVTIAVEKTQIATQTDIEGKFVLRRGFEIPKGANILMAEDIVTTGLSSRECIDAIKDHGGNVIAASCLIDRSNGKVDVGVPLISLAGLEIAAYKEDNLPDHLKGSKAIKPGSRDLKK